MTTLSMTARSSARTAFAKLSFRPPLRLSPQEATFQNSTSTKARKPSRQWPWCRDVSFRLPRINALTAPHSLNRAGLRRIRLKPPVRSHLSESEKTMPSPKQEGGSLRPRCQRHEVYWTVGQVWGWQSHFRAGETHRGWEGDRSQALLW